MASWTEEAKKLLQLASSGLTGLEMIGEIIQPLLDSKTAELDAGTLSVLRTVHAIVDTLKQGAAGKVGADQVNAALTHLRAQIEVNDRQAQADIDAKFPPA